MDEPDPKASDSEKGNSSEPDGQDSSQNSAESINQPARRESDDTSVHPLSPEEQQAMDFAPGPAGELTKVVEDEDWRENPLTQPQAARRRKKRMVWTLLILVLLVPLGASALVLLTQRWMLFPRHAIAQPVRMQPKPAGAEAYWIDTPQGKVESWLFLGAGATSVDPGPAVIFMHGNGELIDNLPDHIQHYTDAGISVLLPEYRGYGFSAGSPSEKHIVADMVQFRDWLASRSDVDESRIIYHGRSLGGAVAIQLAEARPPALLITESTFTTVRDFAAQWFVPGFLVLDPFESERDIAKLNCPILLMHGRADQIVPPEHSRRLADAAGDKANLVLLVGVGHNDTSWSDKYWPTIFEALTREGLLGD